MTAEPLAVLLLADDQKGNAGTVHEHIDALRRLSRHRVTVFNPRGISSPERLDLGAFDVVVIHYSLVLIWDDYVAPALREALAEYDGLKVQFIQDEYRWVEMMCAAQRAVGINVLLSVASESAASFMYAERLPETEIVHTLTGYVAPALEQLATPPTASRPLDVGYRGRSLPYWLGRLGYEKVAIGRGFLERAPGLGLRCDIAWTENARIYGRAWSTFLSSCRSVLASESGASIIDVDGAAEAAVKAYIAEHPLADYVEVERNVLRPFLGGPEIATISPRVFEAAAHRSALVMFPGSYSEIVEPWRHYIPLEKDFSNIEEVGRLIRDDSFLGQLVESTHRDLIASGKYAYRSFVEEFDELLAARATPRGRHVPSRLALKAEEIVSGRGYWISTVYWFARHVILRGFAIRYSMRWPALRRLAPRLAAGDSREDLLRLSVLTSVQMGTLIPATGPFTVTAAFDPDAGRLILTSNPHGTDTRLANRGTVASEVERAVREDRLKEIVWNHATVGQYVGLHLSPLRKRIQFDVGRYDSYGIYRFDSLLKATRSDPALLLDALRPLLAPVSNP
ncbi:MAG TPA: hypothetical protein VFA05_02630 [Gaiellaceae bacterium]|nr:hypothetical protein [Gaiellaceae bacterium]